jgi:signal transduction histidine kinase
VAVRVSRLLGRRLLGSARVVDGLLVMGMAVLGMVGSIGAAGNQPDRRPLDAVAYALILLAAAALLARRRHPIAVLAVTVATNVAYLALGYPYGPIFLTMWVAVYTLAAAPHQRPSVVFAVVAAALVVIVATDIALTDRQALAGELPEIVAVWAVQFLAPLWLGWAVRVRREHATEAVRHRVQEERLRLAREVHDVVAHSIAVINFQAGVAVHVLDRRPEQALAALLAIKQASREALVELRATLGVLRQLGEQGGSRAPLPGLAQLDALVARAAEAGRHVEVAVEGERVELPLAVDLAAYRIVQEALTNVARHSGPADARVRLAYGAGEVVVEVTDDGRGVAAGSHADGGGHGIAGMRERAVALGGELQAGPRPEGGFGVRARLPLGDPGAGAPLLEPPRSPGGSVG